MVALLLNFGLVYAFGHSSLSMCIVIMDMLPSFVLEVGLSFVQDMLSFAKCLSCPFIIFQGTGVSSSWINFLFSNVVLNIH